MKSSERRWGAQSALALACAVSIALTGCTGGAEESSEEPAVDDGIASVLSSKASAAGGLEGGDATSYEPTGEIVADSGFRPGTDGFAFANYGNEEEPQNMEPANVERLFGEQVCVSGTGEDCVLTPAAQTWMDTENEGMDGGHCMGFSVAALRMFAETLDVDEFGAETPYELPLENAELQGTLAESFVYQSLHSVTSAQFTGTPTEIVNELIELLDAGKDTYTLGFYNKDGEGGHAMTPLAVEDKGDGQMAILVYDNNYPNSLQAMEIDTEADTFRYTGATNPSEEPTVYEGDATTQPMELIPTSPGEAEQACPFCDDELVEKGESKGSVLPAADRYVEISLAGDNANHPHLLLTTTDGKQAGIVDGKLVEDIPGVEVVQQWAADPSVGGPEPKFRLPVGTSVNVTIDGSDLTATSKDLNINLVADGKVISAEDFSMEPGQVDELFLAGGKDVNLVYTSNSEEGELPTFFAGVDEVEASYTFGATAVGLTKGSVVGFTIQQESGQILFDASDAKGTDGEATVIAVVGRLDESAEEQVWLAEEVIDTTAREDVYLNYKDQELTAGKPITLEVGPEDGPYRTITAAFQ